MLTLKDMKPGTIFLGPDDERYIRTSNWIGITHVNCVCMSGAHTGAMMPFRGSEEYDPVDDDDESDGPEYMSVEDLVNELEVFSYSHRVRLHSADCKNMCIYSIYVGDDPNFLEIYVGELYDD